MMDSAIPQSNSAIKRQARIDNANKKNFGGKLIGFDDNRDRHFNQRMLAAYIKGKSKFNFGFKMQQNRFGLLEMLPEAHDVLLTDKTVDPKQLDALLANGYCDPGKVFGGASGNKSALRNALRKKRKAEADKKRPSLIVGTEKQVEQFTKAK